MPVSQAAGDDDRMPADHDRVLRAVVAALVLYSEDGDRTGKSCCAGGAVQRD
jgi:hypothetical protein